MKKIILCLFALVLFGCPASPNIIKVSNSNESLLSCEQIATEIEIAKNARKEANESDKFLFANIFPPTGALSVSNILRAKSHADERLELLNKATAEKGCGK